MKTQCRECANNEALVDELEKRLALSGKQVTHLIGQVNLLERHLEEREREYKDNRTVDITLISDQSIRLEESLGLTLHELRSCQNDLLQAQTRIENLESTLQYNDEMHLNIKAVWRRRSTLLAWRMTPERCNCPLTCMSRSEPLGGCKVSSRVRSGNLS